MDRDEHVRRRIIRHMSHIDQKEMCMRNMRSGPAKRYVAEMICHCRDLCRLSLSVIEESKRESEGLDDEENRRATES